MHVRRRSLVALFACALGLQSAGAQSTIYARTADTLRFREVTTMDMTMRTPQGEVPMTIEQDATLAILMLPGDSARAWYDALRVGVSSQMGSQQAETGSILKQPFHLRFDPRGRTEVISSPAFPQTVQGVSDLTQQFADFFLRLPTSPLRLGLAWTDTSTRKSAAPDKTSSTQSIASYRVERDTTVAGEAAFVISMRQQITAQSEGPVPGQPMRVHVATSGTDEGFVVFAKSGRMLGRQRTGTLSGGTTITGDAGSMEITQTSNFRSRIEVVK
jgi:hypothetical protein